MASSQFNIRETPFSIETGTSGVLAQRCGRVAMLEDINTPLMTKSAGDTIYTLPSSLMPLASIDIMDTYSKIRLTLQNDGRLVARENLNNGFIRFSATYITKN